MAQSWQTSGVNVRSGRLPGEDGRVSSPARAGRTPRDMALSLVVLLVPVLLLVGVFRFLGGERPTAVDPAPVYAEARAAHAFPVAEPVGLPDGWQVASAVFQRTGSGAVLRIGWRSPGGTTAQVVESDGSLTAELGSGAKPAGTGYVAGREWQRYTRADGAWALMRSEPGRTLLVTGRGDIADLLTLAGSVG
jgi:hypothetical protein